ncbi:MAG: hypothetical protein UT45_C0004G0045 [Candidatus Daviesbacteria bacterium GW2011_GWA2_39_33]|nr:MAG: hypothetical protein UT45_C0004G0045 [Candidatus Daviesbacteria bacterium GW2011_GWA2_39_33]
MSNNNDPVDLLPWDDIQQVSQEDLFKEKFGKIHKNIFKFAASDKNRPALIESALKSLRRTNPNASYGQAILLADIMQTFAKKVLEES